MVWQPVIVSDCGNEPAAVAGWPVAPMPLIGPSGVAWDQPCCESAGGQAFDPYLVESAPIEAGAECGCQPVTECCEAGWAEQIIVPAEATPGAEWETVVDGGSVALEPMVEDHVLGEIVPAAESVDGLTVMGDDTVLAAPPAEILPTVREEEVPEAVPLGDLPPAGEAGASVLVEQDASAEPPSARDPAAEPVVHEPLRMDAPRTAEPVEPEAEADPVAPEQAPPAAEPEPVNIFEADEAAGASLEPARRWIHARGDRSLVARLVGMPDAESCLLEAAGRRIRVPLESLSQHDQVYVQRIGEQLAAARAAAESRDTAGL